MTLQTTLYDLAVQTFANIVSNLAWIILFIWGIKAIINEIKKVGSKIGENVPNWIDKWDEVKMKNKRLDDALSVRTPLTPFTDEQLKEMGIKRKKK